MLLRFCILCLFLICSNTLKHLNVKSISLARNGANKDTHGSYNGTKPRKLTLNGHHNGLTSFIAGPSAQNGDLRARGPHTRDSTKINSISSTDHNYDHNDDNYIETTVGGEQNGRESSRNGSSIDSTVYLPRKIWPFHSNQNVAAIDRQIRVQKHWEDKKIYEKINMERMRRAVGTGRTIDSIIENTKVILDGPPFANGDSHFGHFLNKTIKDVLLRFFLLKGHIVFMIPGWDCHGMPIEFKIVNSPEGNVKDRPAPPKEVEASTILCEIHPALTLDGMKAAKKLADTEEERLTEEQVKALEIRNKCKAYAKQSIDSQMDAFKKSGIWALWDKYYATYHSYYELLAIKTFIKLKDRGYIHRSLLPQHYSKLSKSVLADSEILESKMPTQTYYISFTLQDKLELETRIKDGMAGVDVDQLDMGDVERVNIVAYTTTGWTILGNKGIAVSGSGKYSLYKRDGVAYIVSSTCKLFSPEERVCTFSGEILKGLAYTDPVFNRSYKIYLENFVVPHAATGVMHLCPAHGIEDFLCISSDPKFSVDSSRNEYFRRGSVYEDDTYRIHNLIDENENFYKDIHYAVNGRNIEEVDERIMRILLNEQLFKVEERSISTDCDWRYGNRLHVRLTNQWVLDIHNKDKFIKVLDSINVYPESSKNYLRNSILLRRSNWCLSRQRVWGTPIPFMGNKLIFSDSTPDYGVSDILYSKYMRKLHDTSPSEQLRPLPDILDVWFESALSELYTMQMFKHELMNSHDLALHGAGGGYIKDMSDMEFNIENLDIYAIEGRDQHRGWYQSTILLHSLLDIPPPFRHIITHGFVKDQRGQKFSKSTQDGTPPNDIPNESVNESNKCNELNRPMNDIGGPIETLMSAIGEPYYEDPEMLKLDAVKAVGADVLRLCFCSNDFLSKDIELTRENLQEALNLGKRIENIFRFLLGVIDLSESQNVERLDMRNMEMLESHEAKKLDTYDTLGIYFLHLLYQVSERAKNYYTRGQFYKVTRDIKFYITLLSNVYISYVKNIIYIEDQESVSVKKTKRALKEILNVLLKIIAPIMPHLAEEIYAVLDAHRMPRWNEMDDEGMGLNGCRRSRKTKMRSYENKIDENTLFSKRPSYTSIFSTKWPDRRDLDTLLKTSEVPLHDGEPVTPIGSHEMERIIIPVGTALTFRKMLNRINPDCRNRHVTFYITDKEMVDDIERLQKDLGVDLSLLFGAASVSFIHGEVPTDVPDGTSLFVLNDVGVAIRRSRFLKCQRCWLFKEDVEAPKHLCHRCINVMNAHTPNSDRNDGSY